MKFGFLMSNPKITYWLGYISLRPKRLVCMSCQVISMSPVILNRSLLKHCLDSQYLLDANSACTANDTSQWVAMKSPSLIWGSTALTCRAVTWAIRC